MKTICRVAVLAVVMAIPLEAQQPPQMAPKPGQTPQPFRPATLSQGAEALLQLQGFNIVLVVGEMQPAGNAPADDVPAAARKALTDMRDFLPFKHYRIVDSQWTSCCSDRHSPTVRGRLEGSFPFEGDRQMAVAASYVLQVHSGPRLGVKFTLNHDAGRAQNAGASSRVREAERRLADLRREADLLEDEIAKRRERVGEKHPDVVTLMNQRLRVQQRLVEATNQATDDHVRATVLHTEGRMLIDSNFTMDPGETVVVGTSKLGGDKALIAIVTAARKGASAR